jgi:hypothetical protein
VTLTGDNTLAAVEIACFSGTATTDVLDTDTTTRNDNVTSIATGTVTPAQNDSLVITALGHNTLSATPTIDSGFTVSDRVAVVAANNYGGALAYLVQTAAEAVTPTWSWSGTPSSPSTTIAIFKPAPVTGIVHVASGGASSNDAGGGPDTAISAPANTTGATFLVMACGQYFGGGGSGAAVASDSKGNTWTALTPKADDTLWDRISVFYVNSATPTVGTDHTFTCAGAENYGEVMYAAFSGTAALPLDQEASSQAPSGTSLGLDSPVTPAHDGSLVIAAMSISVGSPTADGFSVNESMTLAYSRTEVPGTTGAAWAYKIQTTAAAINPTFAWSTGTASPAAIHVSVFKPATAVTSTTSTSSLLLLGVR